MNNTAKKTHWLRITLIVLVACGLAGTILAVVQFNAKKSGNYVSSVLEMNFADAARGLAPNGYPFDVQEMASDEVLQSALEAASLSDTYTPDQIRGSLEIRGIYPEDLQEQIMSSTSVLNETAATVSDYHPTSFEIRLGNEFDKAVSRSVQTSLLENILSAYKARFALSGAYKVDTGESVFALSDYDYIQQLDIIRQRLSNTDSYASGMAQRFPDFLLDGKGFVDISARVANLRAGELSRIEGQITFNGVSKDKDRLLEQYIYLLGRLQERLKVDKENLEKLDKLIESYRKNATIYVSTASALNELGGNSSATYDKIVAQRKAIADNNTALMKRIEDYEKKIADLTGVTQAAETTVTEAVAEAVTEAVTEVVEEVVTGTAEAAPAQARSEDARDPATVAAARERAEADLERLIAKERQIVADFDTMVQAENAEEINDLTVRYSEVRYTAPGFFSGAFLKQVIKTAGPFCAIGLMVCLMLIFISRRKEDTIK